MLFYYLISIFISFPIGDTILLGHILALWQKFFVWYGSFSLCTGLLYELLWCKFCFTELLWFHTLLAFFIRNNLQIIKVYMNHNLLKMDVSGNPKQGGKNYPYHDWIFIIGCINDLSTCFKSSSSHIRPCTFDDSESLEFINSNSNYRFIHEKYWNVQTHPNTKRNQIHIFINCYKIICIVIFW